MHKIFWVSLSAAILAARLSGAAETTYSAEFDQIEELVEKGNWVELRAFLRDRPELTNGDDPFSRELSNFLGRTSSLYSALIIDQVKFPNVKTARIASDKTAPTANASKLDKPEANDADLLLEAELAALKGPREIEQEIAIAKAALDNETDPLLKNTIRGLTAPEDPNQNVELATLNVDEGNRNFDVSDTQDTAALDEPDRAVTSARDAPAGQPSIY